MLADKFEILEKLLREMREENTKSITELKNELAAEREDSHKSITELKYELAAERAAREEKVKEVAALTARLSQAEKTLLHQKDETCKIWEVSRGYAGAATGGIEEAARGYLSHLAAATDQNRCENNSR
ncbi:unnamed protein product [Closterium sp. Naga37s-1]|nr:unnamed protein product [Closterium sp. Naga37s-1]